MGWGEKKRASYTQPKSMLEITTPASTQHLFPPCSHPLGWIFSGECCHLLQGKNKNHIVHLFKALCICNRKNESVLMEQKTGCSISTPSERFIFIAHWQKNNFAIVYHTRNVSFSSPNPIFLQKWNCTLILSLIVPIPAGPAHLTLCSPTPSNHKGFLNCAFFSKQN